MARRIAPLAVLLLLALGTAGCKEGLLEPERLGHIEGVVVDVETGEALADANVTTAPASNALATDDAGQFALRDVTTGSYAVTASRAGYEPNTVTVTVRDGATATARIPLRTEAPPADPLVDAEVVSWTNRVLAESDSVIVHVEYRVRNAGDVLVPRYEVYVRIETAEATFFEEVAGDSLGVGQSDVGSFERYVFGAPATAVEIDGVFPAPPGGRSAHKRAGR
jgi:hypothetical protein